MIPNPPHKPETLTRFLLDYHDVKYTLVQVSPCPSAEFRIIGCLGGTCSGRPHAFSGLNPAPTSSSIKLGSEAHFRNLSRVHSHQEALQQNISPANPGEKDRWLINGSAASTLNLQPSTLNPQPSTLNSQPSTLNPQPSTLNPQPSTLNPQPSTLNPQPSTRNPKP